jgi:beta-phosphoglucomutase-like phosphatase (HAD superfamily)
MGARIGLIIFGCDGVLVDSEMLACGVEARALTAAGYPITATEVAHRYAGVSDADMRRAIEEESGRTLPDDHAARCAAEVEDVFRRELRAVQGIAAVVDAVTASGRQVCIASSSSPERLRLALGLTGLWERFAPHVFSAKMVARGKPARTCSSSRPARWRWSRPRASSSRTVRRASAPPAPPA